MKKCVFDERNGFWYELQGDYYIPCFRKENNSLAAYGDSGTCSISNSAKDYYMSIC